MLTAPPSGLTQYLSLERKACVTCDVVRFVRGRLKTRVYGNQESQKLQEL